MKFSIPKFGKANEEKELEEKKTNIRTQSINQVKKEEVKEDVKKEDLPRKPFVYKRLVDKKLTIVLIENTFEAIKQKETLLKIVKSIVTEGAVCIINYGSHVEQSEIFDIFKLNTINWFNDDDIGNASCLYDALEQLEILVSKHHMHIEENEFERIRFKKIEVLGIGSCKDNGSTTSKETAQEYLYRISNKSAITTKYFCFTEETFINAAEIGFRSIGAISRNY